MGVSWRSAAGLFLSKPDSEIVPSVQPSLCWRRGHQEERRRNTWSIFILLEPTTPASTGTASLEMFHARLALTTMQTFERSHETELLSSLPHHVGLVITERTPLTGCPFFRPLNCPLHRSSRVQAARPSSWYLAFEIPSRSIMQSMSLA